MRFKFNRKILVSLLVFSLFIGIGLVCAENPDGNNTADNSGAILANQGGFSMSIPTTAGTGYHWEVSGESHGVEVISQEFVADHPDMCGSSGTTYFNFHITSGDYYVKLVLISPSGDIVDEVDTA